MVAYYNEHDAFAAQWLRNLIAAGHIAPGDVDERSIVDVRPSDLAGYDQCHFFAGIGVWSHALRGAGVADDRSVWTGSCPCQPFSQAGAGAGFADERHLWPHFHWLISQCRPAIIFGEQVASKDGLGWLDLVQADMEGTGYAFGAADMCAAGLGAPHIRQRLYWVADADMPVSEQFEGQRTKPGKAQRAGPFDQPDRCGDIGGLADTDGRDARAERQQRGGKQRQQPQDGCLTGGMGVANSAGPQQGWEGCATVGQGCSVDAASSVGGLANAAHVGRGKERADTGGFAIGDRTEGRTTGFSAGGSDLQPGPTNGVWRDVDWLLCRDGKWRPVEPGTFPLAHGASGRVGRLRAYGNAIVSEQARTFIEACLDS